MNLARYAALSLLLILALPPTAEARGSRETQSDEGLPRFVGAYEAIESEIRDIIKELGDAGLPTRQAVLVCREGIAKAVSPDEVLSAVRDEASRLQLASRVLTKYDTGESTTPEAVEEVSIALQSGLEGDTLQTLTDEADDVGRLLSILPALSRTARLGRVDQESLRDLGVAFLGSGLQPPTYAAIAGAISQAVLHGASPTGAVRTTAAIVREGGGLIQVTRSLDARRER